jgi:peptidoglycan/xylan/chitin deacetylase (PgdA/CDA1 family)
LYTCARAFAGFPATEESDRLSRSFVIACFFVKVTVAVPSAEITQVAAVKRSRLLSFVVSTYFAPYTALASLPHESELLQCPNALFSLIDHNMSILARARLAALHAAEMLGGFTVAGRSSWRNQRLLVLCYHGVSVGDEHEWFGLYVSQQHLERRIRRLRQLKCTILPLAEALERQAVGELPPRAVALTFDDGTADFSSRAYPVLEAMEAPAMLYQTTWYVGKPFPVFNTMSSYVLWKGRGREATLPWLPAPIRVPLAASDPEFLTLHRGLLDYVEERALSGEQQHELLGEIAREVGVALDPLVERRLLALMNREELNTLDPALVDIQLHTHRHRTPRDRSLFFRELDDNLTALRSLLDRKLVLRHFCYPSGVHFPEYGPWLRDWGALSATTCETALVERHADQMYLPRLMDMPHTPDVIFDAWATGAAAFVPGRGRASR